MNLEKQVKTLLVPFVLWYLRTIGRLALSRTRATVIGIAGSVGKTSTREALYAILKDIAPTHMVAGNSETGVPLGLVGLFPHDYSPADWARMMIAVPFRTGFLKNVRYIIIEMGIDDPYPPKNMEYLLTIVQPDIGIITEESAAHTMQFEKILHSKNILPDTERLELLIKMITREDVKMVKQKKCELGIVNGDNTFLNSLHASNIISFGRTNSAAIRITGYSVNMEHTTFSYMLGDTPIVLQFNGCAFPEDLAYVFAPAILTAYKLNIPADTIRKNLERNFVPPRGRESIFTGINNSIIIDSSYNASKPSVLSFLAMIATLKKESRRRTIVVLADMLELGNESQIEHEAIARAAAPVADTLYLVGPLTKRFILPLVKNAKWFPSVIELNDALKDIPHRSLLLFKGSQGDLWLEESIKLLLKNKDDVPRLCRQNAFWKRVKKAAGHWVEV
jgi:UDP-N-acetylmuramoyl-tripeptide--D-alanyl-D-alanine ligase